MNSHWSLMKHFPTIFPEEESLSCKRLRLPPPTFLTRYHHHTPQGKLTLITNEKRKLFHVELKFYLMIKWKLYFCLEKATALQCRHLLRQFFLFCVLSICDVFCGFIMSVCFMWCRGKQDSCSILGVTNLAGTEYQMLQRILHIKLPPTTTELQDQ